MKGTVILSSTEYNDNDRTKWLLARRSGLGASETAALFDGVKGYHTPYEIYVEKVTTLPPSDDYEDGPMFWGSQNEDAVCQGAMKLYGRPGGILAQFDMADTPGLLAHDEHPRVLATVDRLLIDRTTGETAGVLECKTTSGHNYRARWVGGEPPLDIQVQVQQQLEVTGLPFAFVIVLIDGNHMPDPILIERDERIGQAIVQKVNTFWCEHVEKRVPPELTMRDDLGQIFTGRVGESIEADDDLLRLLTERDDLKEAIRTCQAELEPVEAQIKLRMREATELTHEGQLVFSWRPQETKRLDVKRIKADYPQIADEYTTITTTRTMRTHKKG